MYETCPACGTRTVDAPGIGPCCPNKKCDRVDDLRPESERTPVRIVTPNKPLAERLRDAVLSSLSCDVSIRNLLTEAADALDPPPTPVDPALYAWDDYP